MIPESKGLNPHELAHRWVKDLGTHPDMSISCDVSPTICECRGIVYNLYVLNVEN